MFLCSPAEKLCLPPTFFSSALLPHSHLAVLRSGTGDKTQSLMAPAETKKRSRHGVCSESWDKGGSGLWTVKCTWSRPRGLWDSKVKGKMWGLSRSYRRGRCMFSCVLCCKGTLSVGNKGWSHCFLINSGWVGDSHRVSSILRRTGFLETKRAPVLASDHPHLQDLAMSLILGVNLLLMGSIQR